MSDEEMGVVMIENTDDRDGVCELAGGEIRFSVKLSSPRPLTSEQRERLDVLRTLLGTMSSPFGAEVVNELVNLSEGVSTRTVESRFEMEDDVYIEAKVTLSVERDIHGFVLTSHINRLLSGFWFRAAMVADASYQRFTSDSFRAVYMMIIASLPRALARL